MHNGSRPEVEDRLRDEFSNISHLTLAKNIGFSGGANALLNSIFNAESSKNGTAEWAFLITNDCELLVLTPPPAIGGFYAPLIYRRSTEKVDSIGGRFRPLTGRLRHRRSLTETRAESWQRRIFKEFFYVPGTAFCVHREAWRKLGGFDESLHTYWEDVDLSVRAQNLEVKLGTWPETVLKHGIGKTCHKDKFYTQHLFRRNRAIVSRRHTSAWLRPIQSLLRLTR